MRANDAVIADDDPGFDHAVGADGDVLSQPSAGLNDGCGVNGHGH